MDREDLISRAGRVPALMALTLILAACSHVNRGELDTEILQLRTDMEQSDAELGGRIAGLEGRAGALEARMAELEGELTELEARFGAEIERLELALRFNLPVHFGFNSSQVREEDHELLDRFRGVVSSYYPGADVTVEGFTDSAGSAAFNLRLGQARADAVRGYLVAQGMPAERVRAVSYGEAEDRQVRPKAYGPGQAGMENRRVVLVIDHGGVPPRVVARR